MPVTFYPSVAILGGGGENGDRNRVSIEYAIEFDTGQ